MTDETDEDLRDEAARSDEGLRDEAARSDDDLDGDAVTSDEDGRSVGDESVSGGSARRPGYRRARREALEAEMSTGVVLPTIGTGRRRARRQAEERRRRSRLVAGVAGAILVASLVGVAVLLLDRRDGGQLPEAAPDEEVAEVVEPAAKALLISVDEAGDLVAVTGLFLRSDRPGGAVLMIPVATYVDIPGFGFEPLAQARDVGGDDLVQLTLENLLGVGFDLVRVVDPRSWERLLADDDPIVVDNPADVAVASEDGAVRVRYPEGFVELSASEASAYLVATGFEEPELDRLARRHTAFWRAWLPLLAERDVGPGEVTRDLPPFLEQLAGGEVDVRLLPVEELFEQSSSTIYRVVGEDLDELMPEIAPETAGVAGSRVRVQLLNGVGTPGLAGRVSEILVPAGIRVDLRDNARTFDYDETRILYYRDEDLAAAEQVREALGVGEIVRDPNIIDVVDVTVIMGRDLVAVVSG